MIKSALHALFEPKGIAVIGVSRDREGVGRRVFANLREGGYAGPLYAVNPKLDTLDGARVYPDVAALPERVDLVVVAVPARAVPGVLDQAGSHGVRFAIVLTAGFAEVGEAGARLQAEALAAARRHGLRVVGPNCLGLMRAPVALNASFSRGIARAGQLALVSQSGAICSAVVDWAEARQVGFSTVVSLGAAADVGMGELLDYLAVDPETSAILMYVEGVDQARRFMSGLRAAARMKPVIVVKAGRHPSSGRAAQSHTGAIVGDDAVFDAALRRAGAVRVRTLHELFAAAEVLAHAPPTHGDRLAIITNAGGLGVLAVDHAEDLDLTVATLGDDTRARLAALLPAHAACDNPIDILGDAPPERYAEALSLCLDDPRVDGVIVLLSPQAMTRPDEVARLLAAQERAASKPVLACFMGGAQVDKARDALVAAEVSCFDSPEAAVEAFATLARFRQNRELLLQVPGPRSSDTEPDVALAQRIIAEARAQGRRVLSQTESREMLRAFGIPTVQARRASSADEAVEAARTLGFPVALKIDSPDITHKTEVGGVRLGLRDAEQARRAFEELVEQAKRQRPDARIDGVVVEPMVTPKGARELLVGIVRDPAFGPAIAFGAGGTLVELLADTAVALPPLNSLLIDDMLDRARISAWLGAFRGKPPVSRAALHRVLSGVSDLVCELAEVVELDINPLLADPDGAVALDARIILDGSNRTRDRYAHLAISPFPRHLVRTLTANDGTPVTLRPLRPEDAALEERFVRDLSFRSKYYRFLYGLAKLTPEMLVRFTQLDYDRELAFIAVARDREGPGESPEESALGVARYVLDPSGDACEFAIVIADAWQKKGIGVALMTSLVDAAKRAGLQRIHGEVLVENVPMLELMRYLGFDIAPHPDDPTLTVVSKALA